MCARCNCLLRSCGLLAQGGETTEAELSQYLPPFLWLLRDFHLDMEKDGEAITISQYLAPCGWLAD